MGSVIGGWVLEQMRADAVRKLVALPTTDLKRLWDRYDGTNAPDGHSGEDIHTALNIRGEGRYCAV